MKRISPIFAFLATTATADQVTELTDCYYVEGLRALGVDHLRLPQSMQAQAIDLKQRLRGTAVEAVNFMQQYDSIELLNMGAALGTVDNPEMRGAFELCHYRVFE